MSCYDDAPSFEVERVFGKKPIYFEDLNISIQESQPIESQGKIVYRDPYILINDLFLGIHIVDNNDPENPVNIQFLNLPGNIDFSIKNDIVYANSFEDLVILRVDQELNVSEVGRLEDFYDNSNIESNNYPQSYTGYFECHDPSKGKVKAWIDAEIENPKCYR